MFGWLRRALTPAEPLRPRAEARLTSLENVQDDVDSRLEYLASELKKIRGRQFALEKVVQDAFSGEDGAEKVSEEGPARAEPQPSSAHLARRFRGF